jgi:GTPase SAR1 family protein
MSLIDFSKSEITFKVVYYGPAMSGKTTNLSWIFRTIPEKVKG